MPLIDILLFIASLYMLWRSYFYLVDRDKAWGIYSERQQELGVKAQNLKRDDEWERSAKVQGLVYLGLGVVGIVIAGATFLSQ